MVETTYTVPNCPATKLAHPLALLTDSHNTNPTPILESLRAHTPALILIAGDFVYGSVPADGKLKMEESTAAMDLITGCAAIAPTYISLGNHEWMLSEPDLQMISATGAVVLDNRWMTTEVDGKQVVIGGLSSARVTAYHRWRAKQRTDELYPRETYHVALTPQPDLSWLSDFCSAPGFHVLMSHHPEYYPLLRDKKIEMVVSGHAHGGQWRVFNHGVWSPGQGFWPALTSGVVDGKLVISRGLSNTTVIPRLWNPVEIVYIK